MVMAPTNTPKDEYDLAYGYVLRKDYALAEDWLRAFIKKYPNDRLVADANYWLGETHVPAPAYREAAEAFLDVSTKHEKSAQGARVAAAPRPVARRAAARRMRPARRLAEIPRKYPKITGNVKSSVEREQKRVGCI